MAFIGCGILTAADRGNIVPSFTTTSPDQLLLRCPGTVQKGSKLFQAVFHDIEKEVHMHPTFLLREFRALQLQVSRGRGISGSVIT
jgi:hypothetical protein